MRGYRSLEPIGENALGAHQHRLDIPERVVEVETDRAYRAERHGANGTRGSLVDEMLLTMGNKNYSSWSLRPWILMKHLEIAFDERVLALDTPEFSRDIATLSPTKACAGLAARVAAAVGFAGDL